MTNINTLRVMSTVLLVAYHVIGSDPTRAMMAENSSGWRMFSDLLIDFRMPMFAFIAGAVYALRPITLGNIRQFWVGKFHRIILPGMIAAAVFWLLGNTLLHNTFASGHPLIAALLLSIGHFWFLQALLLLFLVVGMADMLMAYKASVGLFIAALCATFFGGALTATLPPALQTLLQTSSALYLAPYFCFGIVALRHSDWLVQHRTTLLLGGAVLLCFGAYLNYGHFSQFGHFSRGRVDLQSLCCGCAIVLICYLTVPKIRLLEQISVFSFTIYLYHPLGTSASRRALSALGVENDLFVFTSGLLIGVAAPCALHWLLATTPLSARLFLGLRRSSATLWNVQTKTQPLTKLGRSAKQALPPQS